MREADLSQSTNFDATAQMSAVDDARESESSKDKKGVLKNAFKLHEWWSKKHNRQNVYNIAQAAGLGLIAYKAGAPAAVAIMISVLLLRPVSSLISNIFEASIKTWAKDAEDPEQKEFELKTKAYRGISLSLGAGLLAGTGVFLWSLGWPGAAPFVLIPLIGFASLFLFPAIWKIMDHLFPKWVKEGAREIAGETLNFATNVLTSVWNFALWGAARFQPLSRIFNLENREIRRGQSRRFQAALSDFKANKNPLTALRLATRGPYVEFKTAAQYEADQDKKRLYRASRTALQSTALMRVFLEHAKEDLDQHPEKSPFYFGLLVIMVVFPAIIFPPLVGAANWLYYKISGDEEAGVFARKIEEVFDEEKLIEQHRDLIEEEPDAHGFYKLKDIQKTINDSLYNDVAQNLMPTLRTTIEKSCEEVPLAKAFQPAIMFLLDRIEEALELGGQFATALLRYIRQIFPSQSAPVQKQKPANTVAQPAMQPAY